MVISGFPATFDSGDQSRLRIASSIGGDCSHKSVLPTGTQKKVASTNHQILGTYNGNVMPKPRVMSEQKDEIRTLYACGAFTQVQLADKFGLRQGTVIAIVRKSP